MPRPKTKTELIKASQSNFNQLMALVEPLEEKIITRSGACEHWSIKDLLAHLFAWHALFFTWYQEGMSGEKPQMPAPGYTWKTTPDLNAYIYSQQKDTAYEEIIHNLYESHKKIMGMMDDHSDEELFTKKYYKWTGTTSLGAYLGGAYSGLVDALHSFGKELGMAYQIRDDVMGIWATSEETGKPAHDIPQRKKTLPVVYGLQSSGGEDRQRLVEIYAQGSFEGPDIAEVGRILERLGAREYAARLAREYHSRAVAQLESERLEASGQARLREAASFLVERDF